jgi:hypothetical protein
MGVGVLAHVHRGQVQPERRQRAQRPLEAPVRDALAAVGQQRVAHDHHVGDQVVAVQVVASRRMRSPVNQPAPGVEQLLADRGQLEPAGLLRVEPLVARVELGQALEIGGH